VGYLTDSVDGIRWKIEELDNQIMELIQKRMQAAMRMGQYKVQKALPVRNLRVEDEVVTRYEERAGSMGISQAAAAEIASILIRESVEAQARLPRSMGARKALVVGGSGKMGRWFSGFLRLRGMDITVLDPAPSQEFPNAKDLAACKDADIVVVAVPLEKAPVIMREIAALRPKGLVFDIASVKAPIIPALKQAVEDGLKVCSVHPMFGPDAASIYARNVIVCDCGCEAANREFISIVDSMGCRVINMPVEEHDGLIAYVLGMSHALSIAFFNALGRSGRSFQELDEVASTTFRKQVATAMDVAREDPKLYFEIQHANPCTEDMLDLLVSSLAEIREAALHDEAKDFIAIMDEGKRYFGGD
jgi:chorismate mutase/prephenate dehydrogenase